MAAWSDAVNFALITFVGMLVAVFIPGQVTENGYSGPASSAVWGYGAMAIGVFGIAMLFFRGTNTLGQLSSTSVIDPSFWSALVRAPAVTLAVIILWQVALYSIHFKRINQGKVPPQFIRFGTISSVLVFTQTMFLCHMALQHDWSASKERAASQWHGAAQTGIYILNVASIFVSVIMTVIMEFYLTDG